MVVAESSKEARTPLRRSLSISTSCPPSRPPARRRRLDAPLLHDEAPGNVCMDFHFGDAENGRRRVARSGACHEIGDPE